MLMYPEFVFRATDDCLVKDKIEIFELMSRDKDRLHIYMEDSHFLQEIALLYKAFQYQIQLLENQFVISHKDKVRRRGKAVYADDEEMALNTLVSNIFSAAKTLIEMICKYCKSDLYTEIALGIDIEKKVDKKSGFEKYISRIYDAMSSFRLGEALRNISQHGYQIISLRDERASFDIEKILRVRHFNLKSIVDMLEDYRKQIYDLYSDNQALLSFNAVRLEYSWAIHQIYHEFMLSRLSKATERQQDIKVIVQKSKDITKPLFGYIETKNHLPKYVQNDEISYVRALYKNTNYVDWIRQEIKIADVNRGLAKNDCQKYVANNWSYDYIGSYMSGPDSFLA